MHPATVQPNLKIQWQYISSIYTTEIYWRNGDYAICSMNIKFTEQYFFKIIPVLTELRNCQNWGSAGTDRTEELLELTGLIEELPGWTEPYWADFCWLPFIYWQPLIETEFKWLSGNRSSLKIDLITEDPKICKLYCIEKSITNNRNTGNKSLYNCTKKIKIYLTLLNTKIYLAKVCRRWVQKIM